MQKYSLVTAKSADIDDAVAKKLPTCENTPSYKHPLLLRPETEELEETEMESQSALGDDGHSITLQLS